MMSDQQYPTQPSQPTRQGTVPPPLPPPAYPPAYSPAHPPVPSQPLYPPNYPAYPPQPPQVVYYVPVPATKAAAPWDYLAVIAAGALSLVGFFFLPFVSAQGFVNVSATAVQGATTGGQIFWLILGAAGVAVAVAGTSAAAGPTQGVGRILTGIVITLLGVVGSLAMFVEYQAFQDLQAQGQSYAYFSLGAGFWACVIANAGLIIGGFAVIFGG